MLSFLVTLLAAIGLMLLLAMVLLVVMQRRFIYPRRLGPQSPPPPGVTEDSVRTADHLSLIAWHRPPPPQGPVLLSFHGNSSTPEDIIQRLSPLDAETAGIVAASYPGYGANDGAPSEAAFALAAHAHLAAVERAYPGSPIVLHGWSLGTAVATRLAVEAGPDRIHGLILEAPLTTIAEAAAVRFPRWLTLPLVRLGLLWDPHDSLSRIPHLQVPLLWLHGTLDPVLPLAMGQQLFDAAPEPKTAIILEGGDHHNLTACGGLEAMAPFLARVTSAGR